MDRDTKRRLLKSCRIDEPVPPDDPRHYDFDAPSQRLRGEPWRQKMIEVIDYHPDEPTTQIVTGLPGSGKTTELRRVEAELKDLGYHVVFADAGAWIRDDEPIVPSAIQLALVLSLYPAGKPDSLPRWLQEYAIRLWKLLSSEVEIADLQAGIDGVRLKLELSTDDSLFQEVTRRLRKLRGWRKKVFALLDQASKSAQDRLVLILDGLEKRATGDLFGAEEREKHRNHWFGAFLVHTRDLKPPVHVIYTVPPFMVRRAAPIGQRFGHELRFLPMIRVLEGDVGDSERPAVHAPGLRAMREALYLRVAAEWFEDEVIPAWLAFHSGGYMRDLLRLVSECIYACPEGSRITRQIAERAAERVRQTYREGLETSQSELLQTVHKEREFPLESGEQEQRMDGLLQDHLMLRYHNAQSWYDAHPLLWSQLDIEVPRWKEIAEACS